MSNGHFEICCISATSDIKYYSQMMANKKENKKCYQSNKVQYH